MKWNVVEPKPILRGGSAGSALPGPDDGSAPIGGTMGDIPKKAAEIADLALTHGWQTSVDEKPQETEVEYEDGSVRIMALETYVLTGDSGDALFAVGWQMNPFTDRWNVRLKQVGLVTADAMSRRLAAAMDAMPAYEYFEDVSYAVVERLIKDDDPEGLIREWLEE